MVRSNGSCPKVGLFDRPATTPSLRSMASQVFHFDGEDMGVEPKIGVFTPQIIHLFIGFSIIFIIHFQVPIFLVQHPYSALIDLNLNLDLDLDKIQKVGMKANPR